MFKWDEISMELESKYKAFNSRKNAPETVACEMVTIMARGDEFMPIAIGHHDFQMFWCQIGSSHEEGAYYTTAAA